jgi:hypothetical protein
MIFYLFSMVLDFLNWLDNVLELKMFLLRFIESFCGVFKWKQVENIFLSKKLGF